jgi:hypothetical protein
VSGTFSEIKPFSETINRRAGSSDVATAVPSDRNNIDLERIDCSPSDFFTFRG